ncbi:Cytochrome P450 18a1, partial [Stegodyphus mimosarum]
MSRLRRLGSNPLPPGPMGLPILGYLPFLGKDYHLTLTNLGKKFGSVYQIYLGAKRVVVINDHNLIRHAFKQPVFSGRPDTELTKILQGYGK